METVVCPLCSDRNFKILFRDFGYDHREYSIVCCSSCSFSYLNPQPTALELEKIYETYYGETSESQETERHLHFRRPVFEELVSFINSRRGSDSTLVDIGCGNGDFISIAREHGWNVSGAEISGPAVEYGVSKRGLNILQSSLIEFPFESAKFEVATILDVLEHLPNPKSTLKEIYRVLKPGGLLIARVPNTPFQLVKAKIQRLRHGKKFTTMATPLHLNHFNFESLSRMIVEAGFKIETVKPATADGTGLQGFSKRLYMALSTFVWKATNRQIGNILFLAATKTS